MASNVSPEQCWPGISQSVGSGGRAIFSVFAPGDFSCSPAEPTCSAEEEALIPWATWPFHIIWVNMFCDHSCQRPVCVLVRPLTLRLIISESRVMDLSFPNFNYFLVEGKIDNLYWDLFRPLLSSRGIDFLT